MSTLLRAWLGLVLVASTRLAAQADTTRRPVDDRPLVRGTMFDKPYLANLMGRTAIGGYAEAHARWQQVDGALDDATFQAKRFNLFAASRVSDYVRVGAELEFEDGGSEIKLEYAAIDVMIHPRIALRGGLILSPLGRFNLSHDSPLNEFTDRPLVSTDLLGTALSEAGFGAFGQAPIGGGLRLTYEGYLTNGFNDGLISNSGDGTRVALGRGNFEDNNGSPALVGRLGIASGVDHTIGVSTHTGAYNVFNVEGTVVDARRNLSIVAVDAETHLFGVRLAGEGALVSVDVPSGLQRIYAEQQRGFYVEGIRAFGRGWVGTIPQSELGAKVRWDYVDFDAERRGQSAAQVTLGLNFRPTAESVIKLDYVRGRGRDEFNTLARHAALLLSTATYF